MDAATAQRAVDWDGLTALACDAMARAFAPYSSFPVGAAALVDDGRIVIGCNVENASYGLTLCAECGLVSALHAGGGGRLSAVVVVDGRGALLSPCGRCRQLLLEHAAPGCLLLTGDGPCLVTDLLPGSFGPSDLPVTNIRARHAAPAAAVSHAGGSAGVSHE